MGFSQPSLGFPLQALSLALAGVGPRYPDRRPGGAGVDPARPAARPPDHVPPQLRWPLPARHLLPPLPLPVCCRPQASFNLGRPLPRGGWMGPVQVGGVPALGGRV